MQDVDGQQSPDRNIRARRRIMADSRGVSDDADRPEMPSRLAREDSIPGITRTSTTLFGMRTDTYQEIGGLVQEIHSSPTKVLLVFVPAGIVVGLLGLPAVAVFVVNLVALVPLAVLILYSTLVVTEDHPLLGGLVRAVFGNATELTVLGASFLVASYGKKKEPFSKSRTSIMSSIVMSGSICLTIPTVIAMAVEEKKSQRHALHTVRKDTVNKDALFLSRATSIIQMALFLAYLVFRFRTHNDIFPRNPNAAQLSHTNSSSSSSRYSLASQGPVRSHWRVALTAVAALTCTVTCANFLIQSLPGATKSLGISESFAALVVLPQAGGLMKAVTIIRHTRSSDTSSLPSRMSRLDFAIRSIMTNVFNTELFILPILVILGWAVDVPMKLSFGLFEAVIFLLAIMTMTYLVQHGKTTYFEGIMLMGT
ncbi:Vacuolar calcium ion transporter [Conoideocrella luteorostrata]|uniref:Vacuolar calcium ion transporter n=1 Tax=Conoideocrella luteorostrata TaxID=1105319 RepID=A0AAJ0G3G5_9HYPO|nr:Vacuolar calcium ion transporter [Conoideocrella luteorostrata]